MSAVAHADVAQEASDVGIRTYKWAGDGAVGTPGPEAAISSHVLFLNNCKTANCTITPGSNDSRTNHSSIANHTTTLPAFPYNDATWNAIVDCVKQTYAPYNIQIVTTEPSSSTSYFEEIVAGTCTQVDTTCEAGVVGVAPFNCGVINNAITYAFAGDSYYKSDTVNRLCWTIAQESAHAFGLDHEYLNTDPMTYLSGAEPKRFQNKNAQCGTNSPASCLCGGTTQNSVAMLTSILGSSGPTPPHVSIDAPANGAQVDAGFGVRTTVTDDAGIDHVELRIDNKLIMSMATAPYAFNAPSDLSYGTHHVEVRAYDTQGTPGSAFIDVVHGAPCTDDNSCGGGGKICIDGSCVLGPDQPGGLGTVCTKPSDCNSGSCSTGGSDMFCTDPCDTSMGGCPSGFSCLPTGVAGQGVCWPGGGDDGGGATAGCNAEGGSSAPLIGLGLVFGAVALRRRRR
ncbi:MAG TPA: Ig-like domain-containing protein [Kofleriaceae bacterium]|nr:Ig-like domain-containing protein [Kofleriaceae bacterium]